MADSAAGTRRTETNGQRTEDDRFSHTTRIWALFPLVPMVRIVLEIGGLSTFDSALTLVLEIAIAAIVAELLLRSVGSEIVDPLWFGAFTLLGGALVVLAAAHSFGIDTSSIVRPVSALLLLASAVVVWLTVRPRLESS